MNKAWQLVLIFVGIFFAGAVTGGFVAVRYARAMVQKRVAEQFGILQLKQFGDQLQLTREQRDRIKPILFRAGEQLRDLQKDRVAVTEQMEADLKKELTEAQGAKYEELRNEQRNERRERDRRMQRWLKEQRNAPAALPEAPAKP